MEGEAGSVGGLGESLDNSNWTGRQPTGSAVLRTLVVAAPDPTVTTKLVWAGSGFGGQFPLAFPERDLIVVFNGWNILPGGKALPLRAVIERLAKAVPLGSA